jgi:ATP-dependent RNA helicase DHX29
MDEALDWLARNCLRDELPDYDNWRRKLGVQSKPQSGELLWILTIYIMVYLLMFIIDSTSNTPLTSGMNTPRVEPDTRHFSSAVSSAETLTRVNKKLSPAKIAVPVEYDSDIDPDDLVPVYLESKSKLFRLQSSSAEVRSNRRNGRNEDAKPQGKQDVLDPQSVKLLRKIKRIEDDVLFDKYIANQQWELLRIRLEKDSAAQRRAHEPPQDINDSQGSETLVDSDDDVSREAAKMGEDLLADADSDDEAALADLFASLPVSEVDPVTGKSNTVVHGANGVKVVIRDFGKWTGVNPARVLEEACRAR